MRVGKALCCCSRMNKCSFEFGGLGVRMVCICLGLGKEGERQGLYKKVGCGTKESLFPSFLLFIFFLRNPFNFVFYHTQK